MIVVVVWIDIYAYKDEKELEAAALSIAIFRKNKIMKISMRKSELGNWERNHLEKYILTQIL